MSLPQDSILCFTYGSKLHAERDLGLQSMSIKGTARGNVINMGIPTLRYSRQRNIRLTKGQSAAQISALDSSKNIGCRIGWGKYSL